MEALLDDSKESQRFKAVSAKSEEDLLSQGFPELTTEDFHHTFMDLNERVEKQTSVANLLVSFSDQSTLDHLVIYLRLLSSGDLQWNSIMPADERPAPLTVFSDLAAAAKVQRTWAG